MTVQNQRSAFKAFTIVDLAVVLAGIMLLVGILLPAYAAASRQSTMLQCRNNLGQVGKAIEMYARDHQDFLPGPLWSGAYSIYQKSGSANAPTTWSIGYHLAPYFGLPAPDNTLRAVPALECPASIHNRASLPLDYSLLYQPVSYFCNLFITNSPDAMGKPKPDASTAPAENAWYFNYPFGRPNTPTIPCRKLSKFLMPSATWAITDADQRNVSSGAPYYQYLSMPVHNNRPGGSRDKIVRNYLCFDCSVRPVETTH